MVDLLWAALLDATLLEVTSLYYSTWRFIAMAEHRDRLP
jgi:hypothetical protein